ALAGPRRREARRWLDGALSSLRAAAEPLAHAPRPYALLHLDIRSDNARLHGRVLRMFDWPNACVGPHEFDVAAFAQGVAAEGGPEPERCVAWDEEVVPVRGNVLDTSVAAIAGYFAERAWRPPVAGLPRLRSIQRRQLKAAVGG